MKTWLYSSLICLLIAGNACKQTQPDPVSPVTAPVTVKNWTNIDSLIGLTDHHCYGLHVDSLGLVFLTEQGLSFIKKGSINPVPYYYKSYNPLWNGVKPTFYKGIAYALTSDQTITAIPYGRANESYFTIGVRDFALPPLPSTGRIGFSVNFPTPVNSNGQMLVQLDAYSEPEYLYSLQLDATGRPVRNATTGKIGNQIAFSDSTFQGFYNYGYYTNGEQLFVAVARNYKNDSQISSTLLGELQHITPDGRVETALPNLITSNVFPFDRILYAIAAPLGKGNAIYKSTDGGKNWQLLYDFPTDVYRRDLSDFYTIDNRLVVAAQHRYLQEFDINTNKIKNLSQSGASTKATGITITGLVQYEGKVYMATSDHGVFVKDLADFWQYETPSM